MCSERTAARLHGAWKRRYSVLGILFCAYVLCYMDRMIMASALPFVAESFKLSAREMGYVLSAFFVGYALMQVPGGLLADRFGIRVVTTVCITWWSIMTALTALAQSVGALLLIRVLFGVGEGPFPATAAKAISIWFPSREIGRANGFQLAATALGATVAPLIATTMIEDWGWRYAFVVLLPGGLVLAILAWRNVRGRPAGAQRYRHYEGIQANLQLYLSTPALMWCACCLFLFNVVAWGLMNWLPTYLLQARGLQVREMGAVIAVTNLAAGIGYPLGGYLSDRHFANSPRIPILFSLLASAVLIYLAASAASPRSAAVWFILTFLVNGVAGAVIFTTPFMLVPSRAVGGAFGFVNFAGQLAGVVSPLLVGATLTVTAGNFDRVLYCLAGNCVVAAVAACRIRLPDDRPRS